MKKMKKTFAVWLLIMFMATFASSLVYLISQRSLRLGADELPVLLANTVLTRLKSEQSPKSSIPSEKVDISTSLSAFVMVYDSDKDLIASSGNMRGSQPLYPAGVLDNIGKDNESRVTWQPDKGLRFASVAIRYNNGYVVAARSLTEVEKITSTIGKLIILAWLACAVFSGLVLGAAYLLTGKQEAKIE